MHAILPLLVNTDFPVLTRGELDTLQVNMGYRCNQSCLHCHVNAGPSRKEIMAADTVAEILVLLADRRVPHLDITGGAPELNPHFRQLVMAARALGVRVTDRCNLTVLQEPGQEDLAAFLAENQVTVVASMPCYLEENVDAQRGDQVFTRSIAGLRQLNALDYGADSGELELHLVYNPQGPQLPPEQQTLEQDYKHHLAKRYDVRFNRLYTLANMPIQRFGSTLVSKGMFADYMQTLKSAHCPDNLPGVMCRSLISIDWQGYVYDCDFNQMLQLPMGLEGASRPHVRDLLDQDVAGNPIQVADHCYGCTAGQGSSCGGALTNET